MIIPSRGTANWVRELIDQCSVSMKWRNQRGEILSNFFLTGTEDGGVATYNKTWALIDNLSSWLYSAADLRLKIQPNTRYVSPVMRAKAHAAADKLNTEVENSDADTEISQAVTWSLVKGKAFLKSGWGEGAPEAYLVQPENVGVLREDLRHLHLQEAFFHRTWLTKGRFRELVLNHPEKAQIERAAAKYLSTEPGPGAPGQGSRGMPLSIGGQAFQTGGVYKSGSTPTGSIKQNFAYWMSTPMPTMDARTLAEMLPLDELWVWDSKRSDWTTFQMVGDVMAEGLTAHRNLFADALDHDNDIRRQKRNEENPIAARQPFNEFCSIPVDGWFWGRSEIENVAPLQFQLNARVDGINKLLRRQEDPPAFAKGFNQSAQMIRSRISKPGGTLVDSNPNADLKMLAPELPSTLYESMHETIGMFNDMSGFPAVLRGEGESGVRAQGHAATLTQNAAPRHKDRALLYERQIGEWGDKIFRMLQAKNAEQVIAWVPGDTQSIELPPEPVDLSLEPPAPGMRQIAFLLSHIDDKWRVRVDAHSSSPAFQADTRRLMFDLNARGAASNEALISGVHPPSEDELLADATTKAIQQAALIKEHPELAIPKGGKKK